MSKVQTLRAFVSRRLSAAAEEIIDQFERTIAEYEEELCGQRKLLDTVLKPEVRIHRAGLYTFTDVDDYGCHNVNQLIYNNLKDHHIHIRSILCF